MFGKEIDDEITMVQRIVALVRDLVLAVVAGLTALIVAYGGKPESLNALDWTHLIAAAFLIVLGPVVVFFLVLLFFKISFISLSEALALVGSLFVSSAPIPRGWLAWMALRGLKIPPRAYVRQIRRCRQLGDRFKNSWPRSWAAMRLLFITYARYQSFQRRANPYLMAAIALLIAALVFRDTLNRYVPSHTSLTRTSATPAVAPSADTFRD